MHTSRRAFWSLFFAALFFVACDKPAPGFVSVASLPEYQDAALLERAWALPEAAAYRDGFSYQKNGSVCGPTTAENAMRSLGAPDADAFAIMKRHDVGIFGIIPGGITLDELAELLRAEAPVDVQVVRDIDLDGFRAYMRMTTDPAKRVLINFTRKPLFGKGGGHHSPVGGYLEAEDLVFVLDVNEHYKPWLAKAARVFEAMDTVDGSAGKKRGLLVLTKR